MRISDAYDAASAVCDVVRQPACGKAAGIGTSSFWRLEIEDIEESVIYLSKSVNHLLLSVCCDIIIKMQPDCECLERDNGHLTLSCRAKLPDRT